jgi:hypothetical protein
MNQVQPAAAKLFENSIVILAVLIPGLSHEPECTTLRRCAPEPAVPELLLDLSVLIP